MNDNKTSISDSVYENMGNFSPTEEEIYNASVQYEYENSISYMPAISMPELYEKIYPARPPVIDGLLYSGTYLFVGSPKVGKSFFMAQLAFHVSTGTPLWEFKVRKGTVLYLALEDDYSRLQKRLYRMFGIDTAPDLYFSVVSKSMNSGLLDQLDEFIRMHRNTSLIIIDTLQKVRETNCENSNYAADYEIIAQLKRFADKHGICLLLVHHTRKQQADDKFDMISGTNGLLGAADGAFLLHKERRTSKNAVLEISGRDQQDQKLYIVRDAEKLSWNLERSETELWKEPPEPLLEMIAKLVTADNPKWRGTATELHSVLKTDIPVNSLTKKLNLNVSRLQNEYGIIYTRGRTNDERRIEFRFICKQP